MREVLLSRLSLDDSFPFDMLESIAKVMYVVGVVEDSVCLKFDSKKVSPLFAIPIMAMKDNLFEKGYNLKFHHDELLRNPVMQRFFLDSGIINSMNPFSGKMAKEALKRIPSQSISEATKVMSHKIDLATLNKATPQKQQQLLVQEAISVLNTISSVVSRTNLIEMSCKLIELFDNAIYHSDSNKSAYSTAVQLRNGECLMAVYDQGIGIPGAYRNYRDAYKTKIVLPEKSDHDAIYWAMQKGTSTLQCIEGFSRGVGLSSMKDFVDQYSGMICVASGFGYYSYQKGNEQSRSLAYPLQGTLFMMKLTPESSQQ